MRHKLAVYRRADECKNYKCDSVSCFPAARMGKFPAWTPIYFTLPAQGGHILLCLITEHATASQSAR